MQNNVENDGDDDHGVVVKEYVNDIFSFLLNTHQRQASEESMIKIDANNANADFLLCNHAAVL